MTLFSQFLLYDKHGDTKMRKYYLFIIRNDVHKIYQNHSLSLYKILENLYKLKVSDISYGLSLYHSICQTVNVEVINHYLENKYSKMITSQQNRHIIKATNKLNNILIEVNYSCIIVLTNLNFPRILKAFTYYNKHIFVCDFQNQDFFWLQDQTASYLETTNKT